MATTNKQRATRSTRAQGSGDQSSKRSIPIVAIAFVAIAAILVLAIVLTGGEADAGPQTGDVTVEGQALPVYPSQGFANLGDDPAIGQTIPSLSGVDLDGNPMSIGPGDGPMGIAFLAHWCGHCQAEVPRVAEWVAGGGGVEGVELMAVTTSIDRLRDNYPPDAWLEREDWPAPTMRDDEQGSAHFAYGAGGFPFWVFVNADGEVVARTAGQLDTPTLEGLLTLAGS
jgi:thiol-disulfide isomerase/thioredoxin